MLSKVTTLNGYSIQNTNDETLGKVKDIYFDDRHWTVRYLVANTGKWLTGRKVLLSPYALVAVNADHENIVANLTKKQIEDSPSLDNSSPITMAIMVGRRIGMALTVGDIIPTLSETVLNGVNSTRRRKHGIIICGAATKSKATTLTPKTAGLATSRISSLTTKLGRFVISSSTRATGGPAKKFSFRHFGLNA
jgi:sporulation protein YlmC with PRC-barrel domain